MLEGISIKFIASLLMVFQLHEKRFDVPNDAVSNDEKEPLGTTD